MQKYEIVIPVHWAALDVVTWGLKYIQRFLEPQRIILIGPAKMKDKLPVGEGVCFMDGNTIVGGMSKESIASIIRQISPNKNADERAGWYFQQMIKLGYSKICQNASYLVWDADTVPLRKIQFFDKQKGKKIFLAGGSHHHMAYYKSISKLFGQDLFPSQEYTYVAHYMLFQNNIVLDMLNRIEANNRIKGVEWWEKIMYSIEKADIGEAGFSEFETYGEFVNLYYPTTYCMKKDIKKCNLSRTFLGSHPAEYMLEWAGESYDILGFDSRTPEKYFWKKISFLIYRRISYQKLVRVYEIIQKLRFKNIKEKGHRGMGKLKKICNSSKYFAFITRRESGRF